MTSIDRCDPDPPRSSRTGEAVLGVVVITRNEERHIRTTLEAAVALMSCYPDCRIVLVDSASEDATVEVAQAYPISILRYRGKVRTAAAGRRIGFEQLEARYVLFVDGDCQIEPKWVSRAVALMNATPQAGVAYGARRTVFANQPGNEENSYTSSQEHSLGGNALYRSEALRQAGGFNPFIVSEEEGELYGRLQAHGYTSIKDDQLMITHYTELHYSVHGFFDRIRKGFRRGSGQVLRVSLRNGLFLYHARRFNRSLLSLLYLLAALFALAYGSIAADFRPLLLWLAVGFLGFLWLAIRRRSLRSAAYITGDWLVSALVSLQAFLERPRPIESFRPSVERIQ